MWPVHESHGIREHMASKRERQSSGTEGWSRIIESMRGPKGFGCTGAAVLEHCPFRLLFLLPAACLQVWSNELRLQWRHRNNKISNLKKY